MRRQGAEGLIKYNLGRRRCCLPYPPSITNQVFFFLSGLVDNGVKTVKQAGDRRLPHHYLAGLHISRCGIPARVSVA